MGKEMQDVHVGVGVGIAVAANATTMRTSNRGALDPFCPARQHVDPKWTACMAPRRGVTIGLISVVVHADIAPGGAALYTIHFLLADTCGCGL
jgi:hypothetical protein